MSEPTKAPEKECLRCGKRISARSSLRDHWKTGTCQAAYLTMRLKDEGLTTYHDDFTRRVLQGAGVLTREEPTGEIRRWRAGAKLETWAPEWMVEVLREYWTLTEGFNTDEVTPFYVTMIKRMGTDAEYREAVQSVIALGGRTGLRNFILDGKFRAAKMRREADALLARARNLHEEANILDPSPEAS